MSVIPDWWTPQAYQRSLEWFELLLDCAWCCVRVEDWLSYKLCPRCRTAYSPVPDFGRLEADLSALAGEDVA